MSRARRHVITVSLFPFLAVLICIMGALVIILVLMVARVGDTSVAAAGSTTSASSPDDERRLREQIEDAQWKRDLLEKSRAEKSQELANKRAELAHVEEHIQRLKQQANELLDRAKTIDEGRQLRAEDLEKARQELLRLQATSVDKKKKLDELQKKRQTEAASYALIPYDGPNGTRRRPIYIECDELGITIQPEGLVFRADDFQGPLGPGNPLDAALRTIRERLAQGGGKLGEPYPLLVVRPGGILAYSAARTALKSWDDEFGYELIGDDKRLDYGQADPVTTAALEKTVNTARQRQALLASAMPRKFAGGDSLTSFAGEPSGGGGGFGGGSSGGYGGSFGSGSGGFGGGSGGYGGGSTTGSFGSPGGSSGPSSSGSGGVGSGQPRGPGNGYGGSPGSGTGGPGTGGAGSTTPGGGSGPAGSSTGGPAGSGGTGSSATGAGGRPSGSSSAAGVSVPTVGYTQGQSGGGNGTGSSSGSSSGQAGGSNQPGGSAGGQKGGKAGDANSKSRLPNWAVPNARVNSIGVTRPIHVAVLPDRLVMIPEQGDDRQPQQFAISPHLTPQEVDAFVGAVQKEMKSWGLAVQNGFWRPQLIMDVSPQAEQQCRELQTALEGSGFDLQRKFR